VLVFQGKLIICMTLHPSAAVLDLVEQSSADKGSCKVRRTSAYMSMSQVDENICLVAINIQHRECLNKAAL
jgi:hypothetical protein